MILWGGRAVVGTIGPLSEDEKVELSCRSEGGRPQPALTWWLRGHQLAPVSLDSTSDNATGKAAFGRRRDRLWMQGVAGVL